MFPAFPIGATIPSILIACAQSGGLTSVHQRVSGLPLQPAPSVWYFHDKPDALVRHVFAGAFTLHELLQHHTVSPIHLSLIAHSRLADVTGPELWALCRYQSNHRLIDSSMRLCPQCVEEDTIKFGSGHWRREHQIKAVQICTKHLTVLHDQCASEKCNTRFTSGGHILPGQPCPSCHSTETSGPQIGSISAGYLAFCKLFTDALIMRIPELDAEYRFNPIDLPKLLCGGNLEMFEKMLERWIGDQFGVISSECAAAMDFLRSPFLVAQRGSIMPPLMLLAAFNRDLFGVPPEGDMVRWVDRA